MNSKYYEIRLIPTNYLESFENFIFDFGISAVEEENNILIVRTEEDPNELMDAIKNYAVELSEIFAENVNIEITCVEKENADWIEEYKKSVNPIEVGKFYLRPSWHEAKNSTIDIIIDPALAFGTGHHASTRGVLSLLQKLAIKGKTLLDVGTGSGVLAIAASKLEMICDVCDTDEIAVESAIGNAALNNIVYSNSWIGSATQAKKQYDFVIANIVADVILIIANDLKKACKEIIILSGIVDSRKQDILDKFSDYTLLETIEEEGWVSLAYRK